MRSLRIVNGIFISRPIFPGKSIQQNQKRDRDDQHDEHGKDDQVAFLQCDRACGSNTPNIFNCTTRFEQARLRRSQQKADHHKKREEDIWRAQRASAVAPSALNPRKQSAAHRMLEDDRHRNMYGQIPKTWTVGLPAKEATMPAIAIFVFWISFLTGKTGILAAA